jgi:O-antigen biosynthesis protein
MALDRIFDRPRLSLMRREPSAIIALADRARDAQQWELAARLYREALDQNPHNPPIWVQYGHALKESGGLRDPDKLAQAELAYRRALLLDRGAADSYLQLGHVLKIQGRTQEARGAYLRAFALDPALDNASFELAQLGWSERHFSELRARLAPGDPDLLFPAPESNKSSGKKIHAAAATHPALGGRHDFIVQGLDDVSEATQCQADLYARKHGAAEECYPSDRLRTIPHSDGQPERKLDENPPLHETGVDGAYLPPSAQPPVAGDEQVGLITLPAPEYPIWSVIIDARVESWVLRRCLGALARQQTVIAFEVLACVEDDQGLDLAGLRQFAVSKDAGLAGWIAAASAARGGYLVLLSGDLEPRPDWLDALHNTFERFPDAGAVGSCVIDAEGWLHHAGSTIDHHRRIAPRAHGIPVEHPDVASPGEVDFCPLDGLGLSAALWREIGGLDTRIRDPTHAAVDLALRIRNTGRSVICQPFARLDVARTATPAIGAVGRPDRQVFIERWSTKLRPPRPQSKARVLFVDDKTPEPDKDSGSGDIYWFMRIFLRLGYDVTFLPAVTLEHAGRYTDDLRRWGITCVTAPFIESAESYLRHEAAHFELIMLYRALTACRYIDIIRHVAPHARIVLDTVDLLHIREQRRAELIGSVELLKGAEQLRTAELQTIAKADCTILLSQTEYEIVASQLPEASIRLIPVVRPIVGRLAPFAGRRDVVFIGGFEHQPNVDAIQYFVGEIWPLVRAALPSVQLIVVGSKPPEQVLGLNDPAAGIVVRGYVEDLTELMRTCCLTVAPLRYGAGIKGKIVTSLTYGVPCVATSIASEGMRLTPHSGVITAADPATFAAAIVELHEQEPVWQRLSDSGLEFAARNFSIERITRTIQAMLRDLHLPADPVDIADPPGLLREFDGWLRNGKAAAVNQHRVSVIIPLYNHARFIRPAVESVLAQTYPVSEIVIVDDGSTDESAGIAASLCERDPRVIFWSKPNGGAHAAINDGIHRATGDLVAILNSDDSYHPERFSELIGLLTSDATLDLVASGISFIDDAGEAIGNDWYEQAMAFYREAGDPALTLINGNILMTTSNFMARHTLFDEVGYFSPLRYAHDLDFLLRLLVAERRLGLHRRPLLSYRMHQTNTIQEDHAKVKAEWAIVTAFFLHQLNERARPMEPQYAARVLDLLDRHLLARPVQLCMTYFRHHPSDTLERNPIFADTKFRVLLAENAQ